MIQITTRTVRQIHAAMDRRDLYLRDLDLMARCRELAS